MADSLPGVYRSGHDTADGFSAPLAPLGRGGGGEGQPLPSVPLRSPRDPS